MFLQSETPFWERPIVLTCRAQIKILNFDPVRPQNLTKTNFVTIGGHGFHGIQIIHGIMDSMGSMEYMHP